MRFHPEKINSAVERYQNEILRVFSVLDGVLAKSPSGWLVGEKLTIADLSFITWNRIALVYLLNVGEGIGPVNIEKEYPAFYAYVCTLLGISLGVI